MESTPSFFYVNSISSSFITFLFNLPFPFFPMFFFSSYHFLFPGAHRLAGENFPRFLGEFGSCSWFEGGLVEDALRYQQGLAMNITFLVIDERDDKNRSFYHRSLKAAKPRRGRGQQQMKTLKNCFPLFPLLGGDGYPKPGNCPSRFTEALS